MKKMLLAIALSFAMGLALGCLVPRAGNSPTAKNTPDSDPDFITIIEPAEPGAVYGKGHTLEAYVICREADSREEIKPLPEKGVWCIQYTSRGVRVKIFAVENTEWIRR
jgi:hypothetical protein